VLPSPVWRRAPARAWRRGGAGALLLLALLAATTSAASASMFVQLSGDDALRTVRDGIPDTARTADSDEVRLISGAAPDDELMRFRAESLKRIPGLTAPTTIAFSVAPELRWQSFLRPVIRHDGVEIRARLAAVDDPAQSLVPLAAAATVGDGVWLPRPVAEALGVEPGGTVELVVLTRDALHPAPKDAPPDPVATVAVDGVYDVGVDGRRPADPPGTAIWSRRVGGIPTDTEFSTQSSYLIVGDVATATALAATTEDQLMWTLESAMQPGLTLDQAQQTAAGVAELREQVKAPSDEPAGPLRTGLVSGVEGIVSTASSLRDATRDRTALLAAAGAATGLLSALAVLVLLAADRRAELRHSAAIGLGPVRTAGLWVLESLAPAALAVVGGVALARAAMTLLGPDGAVSPAAMQTAWKASAAVAAVGLVLAAVVAAVSVLLADRPESSARRRPVPWVWMLAAVSVTAVLATATSKSTSPGAVALLTPALIAVSLGAVVATVALAIARRTRPSSLPRSPRSAGRWLGWRRTTGGGPAAVLAVAALALGLGMVLVTATAVTGTRTAIADRTAVRTGAVATAEIPGTWAFLEDPPRTPTTAEIAKGKRIPKPAIVAPPEGTTFVFRTLVGIEGDFGYRDVLAVDPEAFAAAASWGDGQQMQEVKAQLDLLQAAVEEELSAGQADTVPVIAVNDSSVSPGRSRVISGQGWSAPMRVVSSAGAFPGLQDLPMLVTSADILFGYWGREDPRLAPPNDAFPRAFAETWLWSPRSVDSLVGQLQSADVPILQTTAQTVLGVDPQLDAAARSTGYLIALAAFVALTSVVVLVEQARRSARRARAADAMLVRVGLGRRGLRAARRWELAWAVGAALVAAVLTAVAVAPLGPSLFDLDRAARPGFEFQVTWQGVAITAATALVAFVLALWAADRGSRRGGAEEVVLRDG
jgi:putative ABC transport system permease protein